MDTIVSRARGYLYLVSVLGVTGARKTVAPEALALLRRVRKHTDLPLALGFGISTPDHVKTCRDAGADGVIVGSAIVDIVERHIRDPGTMETALRDYVAEMKNAAEQ
jgi:tryptophan synthase alpha chain